MNNSKLILNKDVFINTLGTFTKGSSVQLKQSGDVSSKIMVNNCEFFVENEFLSKTNEV